MSAVHELVLQPEEFELIHAVNRPTAKMGFMADELYKGFAAGGLSVEDVIEASNKIDYYKGKITSDLINKVLTSCKTYWETRASKELDLTTSKEVIHLDYKSREVVKSCVNALSNNTQVQRLLHPTGLIEDSI